MMQIYYNNSLHQNVTTSDIYEAIEYAKCEYYGIGMTNCIDATDACLWSVGNCLIEAMYNFNRAKNKYIVNAIHDLYDDKDFYWVAAPMKIKTYNKCKSIISLNFYRMHINKKGYFYFKNS